MKTITWLAAFSLPSAALTSTVFAYAPLAGWHTEYEKAIEEAKKTNKPILVEFTGSDWCPPCITMRKEVFSKKEFIEEASKKFVLLEIDMPKGDQKLAEKNQKIVEKFSVAGFPTALLLDASGKEFSRFQAFKYPSTKDFLKHLDSQLEKKDLD